MLKLIGAAIIFGASFGYGSSLSAQIQRHRDNLFSCLELIDLLSGEIQYGRAPLKEAFLRLSKRVKYPFDVILQELSEKMDHGGYISFPKVWKDEFRCRKTELGYTDAELEIVYGIGSNLGYLDTDSQTRHLQSYREQMEHVLAQMDQQIRQKKKIYRSVSLMAGLMVILLLI